MFCSRYDPCNMIVVVLVDWKHLAKKAAGAARQSAYATGGGPSVASTLSEVELKILSIMGEGFWRAKQTKARVPAFASGTPARQDPATIAPTQIAAIPAELPRQNQQTCRARPRVRRHLAANLARSRILEVEEQTEKRLEVKRLQVKRLQAELMRNELLSEIKFAIVELCTLVVSSIYKKIFSS